MYVFEIQYFVFKIFRDWCFPTKIFSGENFCGTVAGDEAHQVMCMELQLRSEQPEQLMEELGGVYTKMFSSKNKYFTFVY